jgi:hypothetical protein
VPRGGHGRKRVLTGVERLGGVNLQIGPFRLAVPVVLAPMARHAELRGCRDVRKHIAWYLKGSSVGHEVRLHLAPIGSVAEFEQNVAGLDHGQPDPGEAAEGSPGRTGGPRRVSLPEGRPAGRGLDSADSAEIQHAELSVSGG